MNLASLLLITFLVTFSPHNSQSVELACNYKTNTDWWAINHVYFCEQENDVSPFDVRVQSDESIELKIDGVHREGFGNSDVKGFRNNKRILERLPKGLEFFFPNLEFIAIWSSKLKEIHGNELAPFKKLRILSIWETEIEHLEKDLLKYNTEIEYIGFGKNKIKTVDPKVFNHLKKLHTLHFDGNVCMSRQVQGDAQEVWDLVEEIEEKCSTYEATEY